MKSNKTKNKCRIDVYDPKIYYYDLYVCKYPDLKRLQKIFEIEEKDLNDHENADATTGWYKRKSDGKYKCMIILYPKIIESKDKVDQINTCAHEALHYVIDSFNTMGMGLNSDASEAWCYFLGWATECVYKTLISK